MPRLALTRVLVVATLILGFVYLSWRYLHSINWAVWPLALALVAAETYSYLDAFLFGLTVWRARPRPAPPPPPDGATVDVFVTCYNEPVDLVRRTVRAACAIRWPHRTYVLDDGSSPTMRTMAGEEGAGYVVRGDEWHGRNRHAKAGNLNNALMHTAGEFFLVLDADQIPSPDILDRTLGYFRDPLVAFVQTPQWFYNVPPNDPFGSQSPLFYGPIQQGKDGWNAAFFCGSNAVLRREALMQIGLRHYAAELEQRVRRTLHTAGDLLATARRRLAESSAEVPDHVHLAVDALDDCLRSAHDALRRGVPIQEVTWRFQHYAAEVSALVVREDLTQISADVLTTPGVSADEAAAVSGHLAGVLADRAAHTALARREASPLAAIETVRDLLLHIDVDRSAEAQPVMPLSTISVTEDMATAMRLHANGWRSVYHHEVLARGLAPEDLRTMLQQRLRWAQGTIQVLLRENPLFLRGLTLAQRLMYLGTMWSYLSGFVTPVYLAAPILFLVFGIVPVRALDFQFLAHLAPYLAVNQLLLAVVGRGVPTWRGQQYTLALFPLWVRAVVTAAQNVWFGRTLGFVVTPKTRPGRSRPQWVLVRPQLVAMALLAVAVLAGIVRLVMFPPQTIQDALPIVIGVGWCVYDLAALWVVVVAATHRTQSSEG